MYGAPFNRCQLQVTPATQAIHSKNLLDQRASSCIAATHQQPEQSHDDKIVDLESLPGLCLVRDQASIETNTLFSSCLTLLLFSFFFLDLFFVGTAQRNCLCTKLQMSINWGYTIFWGESDI